MIFQRAVVKSPVGTLALWANDDTLVGLEFAGRESRMSGLTAALERDWGAYTTKAARDPAGAATRLEQYFAGDLAALDRQPVAYRGSEFQHAVWDALRSIPVGSTLSYSELADRIGRRGAMRAVGTANGANRIALFVPCHRVIAANGTLWGYGGGLDNKRRLLEHEHATFVGGTQRELALTAAAR